MFQETLSSCKILSISVLRLLSFAPLTRSKEEEEEEEEEEEKEEGEREEFVKKYFTHTTSSF